MRTLLKSLLAGLLAVIVMSPGVVAQNDATPAPLGAEYCTVAPIDPDAYNAAIAASIPPLPASPYPSGTPADATTTAEITEVIQQSIACTNIGDLGRLLAVLDPAYAPTLLGVPYGEVPAAIEAAAAASNSTDPATPLVDDVDAGGLVSSLLGVTDVIILDDGRVAAVATVQREGLAATTFTIYLRVDVASGQYIITNYVFHYAPPEE